MRDTRIHWVSGEGSRSPNTAGAPRSVRAPVATSTTAAWDVK